jgi:copper(I)-binding protein
MLAMPGGLAACSQAPTQPQVTGGYVRLAAVPSNPAAAYFTIQGGPETTALITVTTNVAIGHEMHESMTAGGMTGMKPLRSVPVPRDGVVEFKPGGRHVMLTNVNPGIKPGYRMLFSFTFANGQRLQTKLPVIGAGQPALAAE